LASGDEKTGFTYAHKEIIKFSLSGMNTIKIKILPYFILHFMKTPLILIPNTLFISLDEGFDDSLYITVKGIAN
jgi:hypothetical protein